jgi:hypothetical protein
MKTHDLENKLLSFVGNKKTNEKEKEELLELNKDGLFERVEYVNKKYVTEDGRQLLKETNFEF